MQRRRSVNRRNNRIIFNSSLYNLLAEIGSILQDIIQLCIFIKQKYSYSLADEKIFIKFLKIMRRFCFNRCLQVDFPRV